MLCCAVAGADAEEPARTGTLQRPSAPRSQALLGGDGARFTLYLRADGRLLTGGRSAIAVALAVLARLPGGSVEIFCEPTDRDSGSLADAFAELPNEGSRRALLLAIAEQPDLPRWADAASLVRLARQVGLPLTLPSRFGGAYYLPRQAGLGKAFQRRPPTLSSATHSFVSANDTGRELTIADLDELIDRERSSQPDGDDRRVPVAVTDTLGDPLSAHLVVLRVAAPLEGNTRAALEATRTMKDGRARLRIDFDEDRFARGGPGDTLVNLGLRGGTQAQRLSLVTALLQEPGGVALVDSHAVWLLQAAGIDPVPILAERETAARPEPTPGNVASALTLDGALVFPTELERGMRTPSLSQRMSLPSRR